jgi:RimJ/RimL family protein N-acetyltransferase
MDNRDVMVKGKRLLLVPYLPHHVDRYHEWMQRPDLLESTCSEQLTIEEERENQVSWLESKEKLTFILLCKGSASPSTSTQGEENRVVMIGDCNIFVPVNVDDEGVEVEVMVAEERFRGHGLASEALLLLMSYVMEKFPFRRFVAKILRDNAASRRLFEGGHLGFEAFKVVEVFNEVHYHRVFSDTERQALKETCMFELLDYDRNQDIELEAV